MVMHCKYACHIATTTKYYSMTIGHKKISEHIWETLLRFAYKPNCINMCAVV